MLAFAPDVVLLQEVDRSWYEQHWSPALRARGYDGAFAQKRHASSSEGLATFVREAAFELLEARVLSQMLPAATSLLTLSLESASEVPLRVPKSVPHCPALSRIVPHCLVS